MAKAVAKTPGTKLPAYMEQYAGEGQDGFEKDDILMPRLKLCQSMTPEVKLDKAEEGDLINSVTGEVLCKSNGELRIILISHSKEYILWKDRKNGGGILARAHRVFDGEVARYQWDKPNQSFEDRLGGELPVTYETQQYIDQDGLGEWGSRNKANPDSPPAATEHQNYVVLLPDLGNQMIAMSLSRTATSRAKKLNTMIKLSGSIPVYARIFKITMTTDKKDDYMYKNWEFEPAGMVDDEELFHKLREMYLQMKDKRINVDLSDGGDEIDNG